jgi:tetratricopeptide repeat family protein
MKIKFLLSLLVASALTAGAQSQGYKDGIEFYKAGQYDNAKTILNRTINEPSTDQSLAYYYLGQVDLAQNDKAAAKAAFEKGVSLNPECGYNYVGLGALDLLAGNTSAAQDNFKKAQGLAKKDAELTTAIARAYYNADPVKYAKEIDKNIAKARKDSKLKEPAIYILEGDIKYDAQDFGGAAAQYEQAITFDPKNPEGYVKYANAYFRVNPKFSIEKLEQLNTELPTSALAQRELAEKYYEANYWNKAADLYGKYIQNPNHFPEDKARYSVLLYYGKKYDESLAVANEILAQDPTNFLMQRLRFLNLADLKNYTAADQAAKDFFTKNVGKTFTTNDFTTYADVLQNLGQDSLAVVQYELAVANDPDNADLLNEISTVYTKAKQYPKAADAYALYLSKIEEPSSNDLYAAAGRYLNAAATAGDNAELRAETATKGLEYIGKAIAEAQPNALLYQRKARLHIAGNNNQPNQESVDSYAQMTELLDQDPANMDPTNKDNKLNMYKEAYQFSYVFYGNVAHDKDKAAEIAEKLKAVNALLNPTPAGE